MVSNQIGAAVEKEQGRGRMNTQIIRRLKEVIGGPSSLTLAHPV